MGIMFCGDVSWLCAVHHRHMPWGLGNGGGRERGTYGGEMEVSGIVKVAVVKL